MGMYKIKERQTMTKALKNIYLSFTIIILIWLLLSYIEIISKNIFGGATFNDYNIIVNSINYFNKFNGGIF